MALQGAIPVEFGTVFPDGAYAAGVFEAEDGPDDEFIFGLDRILDGVEVLIRR